MTLTVAELEVTQEQLATALKALESLMAKMDALEVKLAALNGVTL